MKNKLCRRCHDEDEFLWSEMHDDMWCQGFIHCWLNTDFKIVEVGEPPPPGCKYALEQLVLEQEESS